MDAQLKKNIPDKSKGLTAIASKILNGFKAVVDGSIITGTALSTTSTVDTSHLANGITAYTSTGNIITGSADSIVNEVAYGAIRWHIYNDSYYGGAGMGFTFSKKCRSMFVATNGNLTANITVNAGSSGTITVYHSGASATFTISLGADGVTVSISWTGNMTISGSGFYQFFAVKCTGYA